VEYLELNERQTKTRTGENIADIRKVSPKMFATSGPRNPVLIYKLYSDMRPSDFSSDQHPFYLAKRTTDTAFQWFLRQPVGVNKLGQMLKAMAKDAGFPEHKRITNHSVRKFLVQKLRNANIPPTEIMAITGHKNVQSITNYSTISVEQQQKCSNILAQSSKCNHPTASTCTPSCTETMAEMQPRQPLSTVEQVDLDQVDVRPTQSLHQQMSFSRSNNFASQFFGATFHIQNFNVYN